MRRGTWILAISGVMALNNGVGFAADPDQAIAPTEEQRELQLRSGRQGAVPQSGGLPSRYSRGAAAADKSATKNYREELFGEEPAQPKPTASLPWDSEAPSAAPAKAVAKPESQKIPVKPAAADARKFAPAARGAKPVPETADGKVIQAGYDKQPPAAERKRRGEWKVCTSRLPRLPLGRRSAAT